MALKYGGGRGGDILFFREAVSAKATVDRDAIWCDIAQQRIEDGVPTRRARKASAEDKSIDRIDAVLAARRVARGG